MALQSQDEARVRTVPTPTAALGVKGHWPVDNPRPALYRLPSCRPCLNIVGQLGKEPRQHTTRN